MTTIINPPNAFRRRPVRSLAKAEFHQLIRNRTLVFMGTVFPIAMPLATFFIGRNSDNGPTAALTASATETFAMMALLFVQYYTVLSMVVTRRDEGVLKRLRTGEATDRQLLLAPTLPGAVLTVIGTVAVCGIMYAFGAPAPVNAVAITVAIAGGIVMFALLALATTTITKNAEAAQITSLPVFVLAVVGMSSIRDILPENLARIAEWTPFAAVSDLVYLGTSGLPFGTDDDATPLSFADVLGEAGRPLATMVLWTAISLWMIATSFRWDNRG